MPMPGLNITIQNGGLNTAAVSESSYSGYISYNNNYASLTGTTTVSGTCVALGSIFDAQNAGFNTTGFTLEYFHITEFFSNPNGYLFVMIAPSGATSNQFNEVLTLQNFANGEIRQLAVKVNTPLSTNDITTLQSQATYLQNIHAPLVIYYEANTWGTSISSLSNLRNLNAPNVLCSIGQDGSNNGYNLAVSTGKSAGCLGALLGFSSKSISDNIGWIGGYDFTTINGGYQTVYIGNQQVSNISRGTLNNLNDFGYAFLKKEVGLGSTTLNDMPSASVLANNDYAYIPNNKVVNECSRGVYTFVLPFVNSTIPLNTDGTIKYSTVKNIENTAGLGLQPLVLSGDISNYNVYINPSQNIVSTGILNITISILPNSYSRTINVSIGLVTKLS